METNEKFINQTIKYLNKLIKQGVYTEKVDVILELLFNEIRNLPNIKQKQAYLNKLKNQTINCKNYKKYKCHHKSFDYLENTLEYEALKRDLEVSTYDYIYNIVVRFGGLVYYEKLVRKYPELLQVFDRDCNSLFYNISKKYLDKPDEYVLTVISYILEASPSNFKSDITKLRKEIFEKKNKGLNQAYKLDKLFTSYYPNNSKIKETSKDKSFVKKTNHINEHLKHDKIITPADYKDREDLLDYMSFGITNSNIVDNAYYIEKKNGLISIYHHISDISAFLYPDSKIEKDAEKQLFLMNHKNHTGSLFNPEFLKDYISFNSGSEKLSTTIKHNFDETGRYLGYEIFKSAIYTGPVFKKEEANEYIKNEEYPDLVSLYKLSLKLDSRSELSPANKIIKEITTLSSNAIKEKLIKTNTPGIYKHTLNLNDYEALQKIKNYSRKKLNVNTYKDYETLFKEGSSFIGDYHVNPERDSILNVSSPSRNYLDYKNLAILSKLIKGGRLSKGAMKKLREDLEILAARANAVKLSQTKRR